MHKLKLSLENLAVESFDTTAAAKENGTVFGEQCTCYSNCTCPGCPTCDGTCPNTCAYTCDDRTCVSCQGSCESCVASCYCSMGEWCYSYTCPLN